VNRLTRPAFVVILSQLALASTALAQTSPLEDAARLTWRLETRAEGIAALRSLAASSPDDANVSVELGRVLTWDARTRAEGVTLLRNVLERQPARTDVEEALADVLSWTQPTRPEAIRRLRDIIQREPARVSAQLKLAEVLSWDAATRDESRTMYAAILRDDKDSTEAAVGLARVLSWSGRVSEARAWYELTLARNPDAQAARIGIAELEGWNGRARASLKTLSAGPGGSLDTPDALRLRAEAYSQIGRPSRALAQYERLLSVDPGNAIALSESRTLRQGLRPSLEIGTELSTESGDAVNKVETASVPFRFAFHPGGADTEISITWAQAEYRNSAGTRPDRLMGVGADAPIGTRVRISGDLLAHALDGVDRTFTGRAQLQIAVHDGFEIRVGGAREQLLSSRLSLAGELVGGTFYGPSFVTQGTLAVAARANSWDGWAHATAGDIRGSSIVNNARRELFAGAGRSFRAGTVTLRPGYSLGWMSYDLDLSGFPGDDAPGDGLTKPGIGGYFSPAQFVNHMARFDLTIPIRDAVVIAGGVGVGRQRVEDAWSRDTAAWTESSDATLGIRVRPHDRVSFGVQAAYQDVASAFDRTTVRATIALGF
jgi:tetratricopeptide (TPR) repeat protein